MTSGFSRTSDQLIAEIRSGTTLMLINLTGPSVPKLKLSSTHQFSSQQTYHGWSWPLSPSRTIWFLCRCRQSQLCSRQEKKLFQHRQSNWLKWYQQVGQFRIGPDLSLTHKGKNSTHKCTAKAKADILDEWNVSIRMVPIEPHSLPPTHQETHTEVGSRFERTHRKYRRKNRLQKSMINTVEFLRLL